MTKTREQIKAETMEEAFRLLVNSDDLTGSLKNGVLQKAADRYRACDRDDMADLCLSRMEK